MSYYLILVTCLTKDIEKKIEKNGMRGKRKVNC